MTDIVERLRTVFGHASSSSLDRLAMEAAAEIERLQIDKAAISDTASGYLHEIERLLEEKEALAKHIDGTVRVAAEALQKNAEIEQLKDARQVLSNALDTTRIEHERMQDEIERYRADLLKLQVQSRQSPDDSQPISSGGPLQQ